MDRFIFSSLFLTFAGVFSFLAYAFFVLVDVDHVRMSMEHGTLELASAGVFALAAVFALLRAIRLRTRLNITFTILMVLATAREMDLHKACTSDSILKSRFYTSAETPLFEKVIGAFVIALLIYCVWQLVRHAPEFIRRLLQFCPCAIAIFSGLGVICIAKMLDGMSRLFPFLADFHEQNGAYLGLIEESFEMAGAVVFFVLAAALLKYNTSFNTDPADSEEPTS